MNPALAEVMDEMPDDGSYASWQGWWEGLPHAMRVDLGAVAEHLPLLGPMEGPQRQAFISLADDTGYGGAAGGGKTALIILLTLLSHTRTVIFRHDAKQLRALVEEMKSFSGQKSGLNWQAAVMYFADRAGHMCEWGGLGSPGAHLAWRGRPHDLMAVDEATEVAKHMIEFLKTWVRTTDPNQRTRKLNCFNPPGDPAEDVADTGESGLWLIDHYAPWIDDRHPNPAYPNEIRYFFRNGAGEEEEVPNDEPRELVLGGQTRIVIPEKRTFIPARVADNKYLVGTEYEQSLMRLEEPYRSRHLLGEFTKSIADHPRQIIPTKWIDDAMARWSPEGVREPQTAVGVDVARGGRDNVVLAPRHGIWFDKLRVFPGATMTDGADVLREIVRVKQVSATVNIDADGVGASPVDLIQQAGIPANIIKGAGSVEGLPKIDNYFVAYNMRTWLMFWLRLCLNPDKGMNIILPRDKKLKHDLVEVRFDYRAGGKIIAESKADIKKRLRRSTDRGDAVMYAAFNLLYEPVAERVIKTAKVDWDLLYGRRHGHEHGGWMAR